MPLTLSCSAFQHNRAIPRQYTCDGDDISPPLNWDGAPEDTQSLVLIVDDPDAPDPAAPKRTWVHWVLYNISSESSGLAQAVTARDLPPGTHEGLNDWNRTGYGGPCPPIGTHRYFHKLYALDTRLEDLKTPDKQKLVKAMKGHILEQTQLVGTYRRS
jgi:Raf kinase inhibitor-like YbhB/YbcL family protein